MTMNGRFGRYLRRESALLCLLMLVALVLAGSIAFGIYLWKIIYDSLFREPSAALFMLIVVLSVSAVAVSSLLVIVKDRMLSLLGQRLICRIRSDFLTEIMRYRYAFFLQRNSSEFVKRVSEDCGIIADGLAKSVLGVVNLLQIVFWLVLFLFIFPWASLIYVLLLGIVVVWVLGWRGKYQRSEYEISKGYDGLWKILWQIFSGIKTIKLELLKYKLMRKMDESLKTLSRKFRMRMFYANMLWNIFYILPWLAAGLILIFAVHELALGNFSVGTLVFCFLFTERFLTPLNEAVSILISMHGLRAAAGRVRGYLTGDREPEGDTELTGIRSGLELKHVSFTYPDSEFSLRDICLEIPCGHHVAVTGKSGCGKSTLASLMVRLFDPQSGSILIDGTPHTSFTLESLRSRIVILAQDIPIYKASLRENIDLKGRLGATELLDLVRKVGLEGFLRGLPDGLDTQIAEGGLDISGGERQRLGIARALAVEGAVYIFDEATASLDKDTERKVAALLYGADGCRTTLTITHNENLLDLMDIVYRFEGKKLVRC
jgi:ABC-type bacteriocin/lantibiotic exporter with double-glycine peptidase domain